MGPCRYGKIHWLVIHLEMIRVFNICLLLREHKQFGHFASLKHGTKNKLCYAILLCICNKRNLDFRPQFFKFPLFLFHKFYSVGERGARHTGQSWVKGNLVAPSMCTKPFPEQVLQFGSASCLSLPRFPNIAIYSLPYFLAVLVPPFPAWFLMWCFIGHHLKA